MNTRRLIWALAAALGASALSGCTTSDPLGNESQSAEAAMATSSDTIVVGSQDYYSNEIIAELYAQSLERAGYSVDRQFRIGQREVYLPEIESGQIDLFPEYSGNLLQYWEPNAEARTSEEVYQELAKATPSGLQVLAQSKASDQDSYTVTQDFADKWDLTTIGDLTNVTDPLVLGGNSELETRPYGPEGLLSAYGVEVGFTPIEDSGGPLTLKALSDGSIQLANIYTADPAIAKNGLVVLSDPEGLFLASHVVPVASDQLDPGAAIVIDNLSASLTPEDLIAMNARSVEEELPAQTIAKEWLAEQGS